MKNKITDKQKIKALERIVKAIFGRQEADIEYKHKFKGYTDITLECDVDDVIKVLSNLNIANIDYWFYTNIRKHDKKYIRLYGDKYEGYTEINLTVNPQYWKQVEQLKEEIKRLKEKKDK